MHITAISDFHGMLPEIDKTDLLLICGDISPYNIQHSYEDMRCWVNNDFKNWIDDLNCKKVIMIAGNHDYFLRKIKTKNKSKEFENIFIKNKLTYLCNEYYEYEGLKIFGTPYCHIYGNWPFMLNDEQLKIKFKEIPANLDILITHDPVFSLGNSDVILQHIYTSHSHLNHVGNLQLRKRLDEIHDENQGLPKYCFCGHIHSGDHSLREYVNMKYANVSLTDEHCNEIVYKPLIINI